MPLVRISLRGGKPESYRSKISQQVYEAMRETLEIPEGDRFQVITEHADGQLVADPAFMGIQRSADFVLIQIFCLVAAAPKSSRRCIAASLRDWRTRRVFGQTT